MEIIVKNGVIEKMSMAKEIAKPVAFKQLSNLCQSEDFKSRDPWWRKRIDWSEAKKNAEKFKKNLANVTPDKLTPQMKDRLWLRAKFLKDQFVIGMLSREELHPVKAFSQNGSIVWVVDEEKLRQYNSVARNNAWNKKNEVFVREFKNIMRYLCPDNPRAGDIEKFRPQKKALH